MSEKLTTLSVLGSTGSIGTQTLDIVDAFPDRFRVVSLAAGKNLEKIRQQIQKYLPELVVVESEADADTLQREFPQIEVDFGERGLLECVSDARVDRVVMGIMGFAALAPTLEAVRRKKIIALANKESLVVAGALLKKEAKESGAQIIPVDSEHNALYQLLDKVDRSQVASLVLTASGGPLLRRPDVPLEDVTPAMATAHPNWKMGPKISVDSATLMNKGLELIEAHYLFEVPENAIEVWIHPQSMIHGAVWLCDNTCLAQLSIPNMKSCIGYALEYPRRLPSVIPKLTLAQMSKLEFLEPDTKRFPALNLAREALKAGPSHLVVLNAANEVAVAAFLEGKLLFSKIPTILEKALDLHRPQALPDVQAIYALNSVARHDTQKLIELASR